MPNVSYNMSPVLNAMLTLYEQKKREEEQARQYAQQMAMQRQQQQYQTTRDDKLFGQDQQIAQQQIDEQRRRDRESTMRSMYGDFQQTTRDATRTMQDMQGMRNEDATYRQLMQNEGIPDPGLQTGQYKAYYTSVRGNKEFDALHPPVETIQAGDTTPIEQSIQREIQNVISRNTDQTGQNAPNAQAIAQELATLDDDAYMANLWATLADKNPEAYDRLWTWYLQVLGNARNLQRLPMVNAPNEQSAPPRVQQPTMQQGQNPAQRYNDLIRMP